jgi:hypothetical protein
MLPEKPDGMDGEVNVAAGANSDGGYGPTDPGIRLLTKIADFVEPLTRFDRGHLTLETSEHVNIDVLARQVFRVSLDALRSEGNGGLPPGATVVADAATLTRESAAQLASAKAMVPHRLAAWAQQHGETPTTRPSVEDCFTTLAPVGHVETCAPCAGSGKIPCSLCDAAGTLRCEACAGRGSHPCTTCNATGDVNCATCQGLRTVLAQKERRIWDAATNAHRVEYVQESIACATCAGEGKMRCARCGGKTTIACMTCHGQKTIQCTQCGGAGSQTCQTCAGEGRRFFLAQINCAVKESFETTVRSSDPETAGVLKALSTIEDVLRMAGTYHATSEISADTLRRETRATTPVTTVTVQVGAKRAQVRGFGPHQDVLDYRNIAGMLLFDDLVILEQTLETTRLVPPRIHDALFGSLSEMLASEANVTIVESAAKKDQSGVVRTFKGVVTEDYILRAGQVLKKAVGRVYWAGLAKGPIAVLAIPLLYAPVDLLVRNQGQGPKLMALLGVMLMTFFAALAAHYWCVHQLQVRLALSGSPKISRIVDRLNLTLHWLLFAGGASLVLTLAVASLVGVLFPPPAAAFSGLAR